MARQHIFLGSSPNDDTGDPIRDAFDKVNDNDIELYDRTDVLSADIQVDVGSGGDFADITSALEWLSSRAPVGVSYISAGVTGTINLLSGFVMSEQVLVEGVNLSWVTIQSVDAEVTVDRSALTTKLNRWFAAFQIEEAVGPRIDCLFSMDTSGTAADTVGFYVRKGAHLTVEASAGFKNAGERNVDCTEGSTLVGINGVFTGAGVIGVRVSTASRAYLGLATLSGNGTNLSVASGCGVDAFQADLTGSTVAAALSVTGISNVNVDGADLSNPATDGINADSGAQIDASNATIDNAGSTAIFAKNGACVQFENGQALNATGTCVDVRDTGRFNGQGATCTGAGGAGLVAQRGAYANVHGANFSGATTQGIYSLSGSHVNAVNCNAQKGASPGTNDFRVGNGGIIAANGGTGGTWIAINTLTADGIIFQ